MRMGDLFFTHSDITYARKELVQVFQRVGQLQADFAASYECKHTQDYGIILRYIICKNCECKNTNMHPFKSTPSDNPLA